ncbi:MAG: protein adenylyltransferase SelO family protein, partial [Verrucomicrobiota bacterium]
VMNTDNCAISGETIDYGPCAFMDAFHPKRVFSSIDTGGRYAWNNQPDIALWNLTRFAETFLPLLDDDEQKAISLAETALKKYPDQFSAQYQKRFRSKLALPSDAPNEIIQECLDLLAEHEVDFTLFFRHLTRIASGDTSEALEELFKDKSDLQDWLGKWRSQADSVNRLLEMRQANPILIPRNHRIEQAIQAAYRNDYGPFNRLVEALANPYSENPDYADLELAPKPRERVNETFCGT